MTPLHHAAMGGNTELINYLIDKGAGLEFQDAHHKTPVHLAATNDRNGAVSALLQRRAALETRDDYGRKALILCARERGQGATGRTLIESGADINAVDKFGDRAPDLKAADPSGEFLLHSASAGGSPEIAGLLFNSFAFPDAARASQADAKPTAPQERSNTGKKPLIFAFCVATEAQRKKAGLLIDSIRRFGGQYSRAPIYAAVDDRANLACAGLKNRDVQILPLDMDEAARGYPFAHKVYASAQIEEQVASSAGSLAWFDVETLVAAPPCALELDSLQAVAMRPVFLVNNVGQEARDAGFQLDAIIEGRLREDNIFIIRPTVPVR